MHFVKKHPLVFIFLLGILLRFSLLFLDFAFDVHNHIVWAKDLLTRGPQGFYDTPSSEMYAWPTPNYPTVSIVLFSLFYPLQQVIHAIVWFLNIAIPVFPSKVIFFIESRTFLAGLMKLPAVLADLGLAWIATLYVKKLAPKNKKLLLLAPSLILYNPVFFYNSAYWGQIDVIPIFFVMWSVYLLLFTKRYLASAILFLISLLVKPTSLVFLPVYAIFFYQKFGFRNILKSFAVSNILFVLSFLPFLKNPLTIFEPYAMYSQKILAAQSLPYVTNAAFNFWLLVVKLSEGVKETALLLGVQYKIWGYVLAGVTTFFVLWKARRYKDHHIMFFFASFLVAFAAFLFLTKMHERYLTLSLPFLLLMVVKDQRYLKWFGVVSTMAFLNLYHSWSVPRIEPLVGVLTDPVAHTVLSLVNLAIFLSLLWEYLMLGKLRS